MASKPGRGRKGSRSAGAPNAPGPSAGNSSGSASAGAGSSGGGSASAGGSSGSASAGGGSSGSGDGVGTFDGLSLQPRVAIQPKAPTVPNTGNAKIDAMGDCIDRAIAPFVTAPDPAKGALGYVEQGIGAVMGVMNAPLELLNTGFAMVTAGIAAAMPGLPAATMGAPHLGIPHAHAHPPSLVPPAPPIPLPSIGSVLLPCAVSVLIGGMPAARAGDLGLVVTCGSLGPAFDIFLGSSNTFIGGNRAARMTDITRHCNPSSKSMIVGRGAAMLGAAVGLISAGAAAAAGQAMAAAMAVAQAAADAAAAAMSALCGTDPGVPPGFGALMFGVPNVLIGGFPVPNFPNPFGAIMKGLKKLGAKLLKNKALGKLLKKVGLCNDPGEPISPFTGEVYNDFEDYVASDTGFRWERHYRSGWNEEDGPLGYGHRHFFDRTLTLLRKRAIYSSHDNEEVALGRNDDGTFAPTDGFSLVQVDAYRYELKTDRSETLVFSLRSGTPPTGRLERYTAPGVDILFFYDNSDQLRALSEQSERGPVDTHFQHDGEGYIVQVMRGLRGQAPLPISRYVYRDGCLVEWHDALGGVKRYRYDASRRMVQATDRRGYSFHWEYDPRTGRCIKSYGDDGLWGVVAKYEGTTSTFTETDGSTWTYKFYPDGTVSHLLGPDGGVLQYVQDVETGRIVKQIEPGGAEYTWLYDSSGKHFGRLDPYGNLVPPEDEEPNPNSLAHNGPNTAKGYLSGRPLSTLVPAMVEPPALVAQQLAQLESLSPWFGTAKVQSAQYDASGQLLEEREPDGSLRRFHYDAEGDCDAELLIPSDARRQAVVAQSPRQGWWTRQYTSFSLLSGEMSPLGNTTRYEYTHREKWRAIVDANGNRTEYVRDGRHRISEIRRFGGVHRRYVHDVSNAVVEEQDADGNTLVKYETGPTGLHTSAVLASGEQYTYAYNSRGQFTTASSLEHEVIQRHVGRKLALDQRDGKGVEHEYGTASRVAGSEYFERFKVRYDYLSTQQLRITTPDGAEHIFWNSGQRIIRENGNGTSEALSFDAKDRLCARACWHKDFGNVGPHWSNSYRYDAAGNLVARMDTQTGADLYEYDADNRLVAHQKNGGAHPYAYDAAGNLVRTARLGHVEYAAGSLLRRADLTHYTHDSRFRRATKDLPGKSLTQYVYDSLDQLIEARLTTDGKEKLWRAAYDGLGRRLWREIDGKRTDFYWDDDRLAAERFPDGKLRIYVYPNEDALVPFMWLDYASEDASPESGKAHYLFTDPSGMPVRVEDATGKALWQAANIDPYGQLEGENGAECPTRLRFAGHFHDEDLGLFYNRFRDYDPEVGRYLQPDPLGHAGGINLFAYSSNPLVEVDLRGLAVHRDKKAKESKKKQGKEKPSSESDDETPTKSKPLNRVQDAAPANARLSNGKPMPKGTVRIRDIDEHGVVQGTHYVDPQGRTIRSEVRIDSPPSRKKESSRPTPQGMQDGDHRGHGTPERHAADQRAANVPENLTAEHPSSNLGPKKRWENQVPERAANHPGSEVVSVTEPKYPPPGTYPEGDARNMRPVSSSHGLEIDGKRDPNYDSGPIPNDASAADYLLPHER